MNRRDFLKVSALAGAMPLFNIGCANFGLSRARQIARGDRIRVALIGCGLQTRCMCHLEERNKLLKTFRNPFRDPKKPFWRMDRSKPYEIAPDIYEYYKNGAGLEPHRAMTEYNAKENYGSAAAAGVSAVPPEEPKKDAPKTNAAGLNYNPMID